jgi:hypothetical protein
MHKTDSGLWTLVNYTRYRTDDLLELFNLIEKELTLRRVRLSRGGDSRHAPAGETVLLYIDTYRPVSTKSAYTDEAYHFVKSWDATKDEIRICSPDTLPISPIELLSKAQDADGIQVPEAFMLTVVEGLCRFYADCVLHRLGSDPSAQASVDDIVESVATHLPNLRYMPKAENRRTSAKSKDQRLRDLSASAALRASYPIARLTPLLQQLREEINTLNSYSQKRSLPNYVDIEFVDRITAEIHLLHATLLQLHTDLKA